MFKHIKIALTILALAVSAGLALGASCGSDAALTDVLDSISVNTLDGAEGVPVDSTFKFAFSGLMTASTITTSTFFIVKNEPSPSLNKAVIDDAICDSAQAIDATVECSSPIECTLTPAEWLEYITAYSICLTSDIQYVTGVPFEGFMASFTTAERIISSIQLVRLDGTELEFTDRPIPRMVSARFALSVAVTDESERAAFESSVTLADEDNNTVDGTYEWATDFLSVAFMPNHQLEYGTEYTINVSTEILPLFSFSKALENQTFDFTTMAEKDINGDGFADVIVGAYGYPGVGDQGRAYVYLGSASGISDCDLTPPSTCVADTTITGENNGDWLGWMPSVIGDVNADGFADIIVGAMGYDAGNWKGRAYVFLGSATGIGNCDLSDPTCVPHAAITGENNSDLLGWSVSNAGDVNGDGYDDIIVGAHGFDGVSDKGRAYILLGSESGIADCDLGAECVPDATITGENNNDYLGISVSNAGDVNGDGYDDVVVGARGYPDGYFFGRAYIFLGSAAGIGDCDLSAGCISNTTITGEGNIYDSLGFSVSTAGDVNADGYDDIIVGALSYDGGGGRDTGQAYVFLGGSKLPENLGAADADATITGGNTNNYLGQFTSGAGDTNADGYDDIIVGARGVDIQRGRAYVLLGSEEGIADCDLFAGCIPDATITGENNNDLLNIASNAGDVDADGYADVIIGAFGYNSGTNKGRAYIFMGSGAGIGDCDLGGECTAETTLTGENEDDYFGGVN